ncbi:MAG: biotin--[acetyl-CoA-carboxylase] ligase [Chloroflexi bacterium]|nr:MAG: biotin--[acetyl-CoA-carboxylase] ligase [Chloroflexota bacterium]
MVDELDQGGWAHFAPSELQTKVVGQTIRFFPTVGSTNDLIKDEARAGAAEGLVFVADEQVAGRGRRGRSWTAPAGSSLLVSVLLRPTWLQPHDGFLLTILAAVAAAEALETPGLHVDLKWPNDLQIAGRKLGGILVETEISADRLVWAVLGCGINVNWHPSVMPELASTATSLSAQLGHPVARRPLLHALLTTLDTRYAALRSGAQSALLAAWRDRLSTLGQLVRVETPQGLLHGRAEDVTAAGGLVIRDQAGERHVVTAGDVTVRPDTLGGNALDK